MVKSKIIALVLTCMAILSMTCYAAVDPDAFWYPKDDGTMGYDQAGYDYARACDLVYMSGIDIEPGNYWITDTSTGQNIGYDYEAFIRDYNALLPPVEPSETENEATELETLPDDEMPEDELVEAEDELMEIEDELVDSEGNLVVDVSDNSVSAIADAVTQANNEMFNTGIDGGQGYNLQFPKNTLDDYPYLTIWLSEDYPNYYFVCYSKDPVQYSFRGDRVTDAEYNGNAMYNMFACRVDLDIDPAIYSWADARYTYAMALDFIPSVAEIAWSSYDIYNLADDTLVHPADSVSVNPTVSFDTGISGLVYPDQALNSLELPQPTYEGLHFSGWYLDPEFKNVFTVSNAPAVDFTLYGKWSAETPMSTFHQAVFSGFDVLFSSEPFVYIAAFLSLLVVIGCMRMLMYKNL